MWREMCLPLIGRVVHRHSEFVLNPIGDLDRQIVMIELFDSGDGGKRIGGQSASRDSTGGKVCGLRFECGRRR